MAQVACEDTFSAVAQLCQIVNVPLTVGPEATVSASTSDPLLTILPNATSVPPVSTPVGNTASSTETIATTTTASVTATDSSTSAETTTSTTVAPPVSATASSSHSSNGMGRLYSPSEFILVLGAGVASLLNLVGL
ncbi:hypothetical protein H2200_004069 [Cladophialophora chaetospira]|uniref:Uncharacterized protein n=1 Tax=Cladophialophora chaetospira TaxID=386627 RepID=A0AA39CLC3_9EURO|nr:hypothetical protein H2200_004069 [Cladophialophora chaetospira]